MEERTSRRNKVKSSPVPTALPAVSDTGTCRICKKSLLVQECPDLIQCSQVDLRRCIVGRRHLCFKCLDPHYAKYCDKVCTKCGGPHHLILCYEAVGSNKNSRGQDRDSASG